MTGVGKIICFQCGKGQETRDHQRQYHVNCHHDRLQVARNHHRSEPSFESDQHQCRNRRQKIRGVRLWWKNANVAVASKVAERHAEQAIDVFVQARVRLKVDGDMPKGISATENAGSTARNIGASRDIESRAGDAYQTTDKNQKESGDS